MLILQGEPVEPSANTVLPRCGFLRRWWHGRLRAADVEMMLDSIRINTRAGSRARDGDSWQEVCWEAWTLFLGCDGQEHWHCACGVAKRLDRTEVCVTPIRALAKLVA